MNLLDETSTSTIKVIKSNGCIFIPTKLSFQNCLCCLLMIILGDKNDNPPADATWLDNPYAWLRDK